MKLLGIYLNDHLAGSVVGQQLSGRAASSNEGTPLGDFLAELQGKIEEEQEVIKEIMDRLGIGRDPLKPRVAWVGEKLGRFKPNGQITGYSPLSRLVELEGLTLGVTGKLGLWRALERSRGAELADLGLGELAASAEEQRDRLEAFRLEAAEAAFGTPAAGAAAATPHGDSA